MDTTRPFELLPKTPAKARWFLFSGVMLLLAGCGAGAGSGSSGNNIAVSITNKITSVQAGTVSMTFLATVQNDSTNSGVTWSLTANGTGCSPACGTLTLATPASVTYTPPASGPATPNNQPTLTATSVAKANKSDSDAFTISAALTVGITNKFTSVNTGSRPFVVNATVQNDPTNSGVSWTLTTNGAACTVACGTLTGTTVTSVTYNPPTVPPSGNVTLAATSVHDSTKSDSDSFTIGTPAIMVTIQGKFNSIIAGSPTIFVEANVINDPSVSPAVTWTLTANNSDCQPACGTLTTVGAAGLKFMPPASVPAAPNNMPTLKATSKMDPAKSDSDMFTITVAPPISVTITKLASILATGAGGPGVKLSAYMQNDFSSSGVTWTLTCTPSTTNCGTLSPGASSISVNYSPPPSAPAQATVKAVSNADGITSDSTTFNIVSSVTNACGSPAGSELLLKGHYAILLQGFWSSGGVPSLMAASFQADGLGNISGGDEDFNDTISPQHLPVASTGSLYTIGSDHRGCLQLSNSGGTTTVFHFSVGGIIAGVASRGHVIEFDNISSNGAGARGSGILRLQDPNSFVLSALQSEYAFGVDGWTQNGQFSRLVGAGWFTNSGGNLQGVDDLVYSGGITSPDTTNLSGGISSPISPTTGRTTGNFDIFDWTIYMVNSSEFFVLSADATSSGTVSIGRAIATANSFTAASLSGNYIVHATGNTNSSADVNLELWTMTPGGAQTGTLSGAVNSYGAGNGAQTSALNGVTYNVDPGSGRTTLGNPGDNLPVLYLTTPTDGIAAFVAGVGPDALFGVAEPQINPALAAGTYVFGTEDPADNAVTNKVGVESAASGGALTITYDQSNTSGLLSSRSTSATVSLNSNGTGNIGPNTVAITSGSKLFSIDETGGTSGPAAIVVAEQ